MATLLSSVSHVFAADVAITGRVMQNSSTAEFPYATGSHGSIVFAGDNDLCGVDNVIGRGGKQQEAITNDNRITAEEQYRRFIENQAFSGRNPYGTMTEKVNWAGDGTTTSSGGYMGSITSGSTNIMPEAYGVYFFAVGCGSAATGNYSTVFGAGVTAKAGGAQAFGVSALASRNESVTMGIGAEASGDSAVAIGAMAQASGLNAVALGAKTKATMDYAVAIGSQAEARASGAIAIGGSEPVRRRRGR
ncbi:hypothetical protein HNQ69_001031 [Bartonella callosciuri]|uniref:Trimeric autotransporter adhesin YadA-like head domain-containing protein n=1 Tax=Bartonella callosciuri TaxID=686223 RepID=A0A840NVE2_9HYPH|nr:hypothetical protein [Bartonella callosciuri]MBB5073905.1 hypothetical protein [Bartonella callosciuri]